MKVLVACEYSGVVREAFRAKGHEVWSVDLLPSEDTSPWHYQGDVLEFLKETNYEWDLMIAHPPCTYLCNSGVSHLWGDYETNDRWLELDAASYFFHQLYEADIEKICVENPVPHRYAALPKYDQIIQPYMFGDDASKRTCLWLKNLPALFIPPQDEWYPPRIVNGLKRWSNQTDSGQNRLGPSSTRWKDRSRTYQGIANAMAEAWG